MPIISLPVFASEPPKLLLTGTPVLGLFSELLWLGRGGGRQPPSEPNCAGQILLTIWD